MKICILAYWYPPLQAVGSLRAQSFVKYAKENDCEAFVISIEPNTLCTPQAEVVDLEEAVYRIPGFDSNFLLRHLVKKLTRKKEGQSKDQYKASFKSKNRFFQLLKSLCYFFYRKICCFPDTHFLWYMMGKKKFIELIEKEKPDIVLTTAYPVSAFFFGRLLKKKYPEIKWIADYRDLWSEHQWYERPWPFNKFEQVLEKFTLKKADEIITTSKEFQEKLQLLHQRESIPVIYNGYDEDINDKPYESDKFIISYTGVLYEQQRPDIFLEAIKNLIVASKIDKELLQIDFYGKMPDYLEALVGQYGLTTLVNLHGVIPRAEVIQKQRQSNLLLLIRWDKGPLHVKVFEYLSARIPVLAMVSRKSEIADLVESSLCGEVCTAGNEVADYVFSYYDYWKTEKSNRLVKISPECEFFSRGNQAARLFKELQKFSK